MLILIKLLSLYLIKLATTEIPNPATQILHHRCNLEEEDFWRAYMWNFNNSSEVNIITLVTRDSKNLIDEFITEMLKSSTRLRARKRLTFYISTYSFKYLSSPNMLKNNTNIERCEILQDPEMEDKKEIDPKESKDKEEIAKEETPENIHLKEFVIHERMRSFSAELTYAFNLVVWDIEDFFVFLVHKFRKVFPKPRGIYMVAFISPSEVEADDIEFVFRKIWNDFGVLNIVFQMPCSCSRRRLYMYKPLEIINGTRGQLVPFHISEAETNSNAFTNSLHTLNRYPLKVSIFNRIPTMMNIIPEPLKDNRIYKNLTWSNGYIGLDGMLMGMLAERLDFIPFINCTSTDYGSKSNGSLYGIVEQVANRKIDISFNSRFVEGGDDDLIEYLSPVINDKFCLIVPKASKVPQWLSIFRCFDLNSWILMLFAYIVSSVYWYNVEPITFHHSTNKKQNSKPIRTTINSFLHIFSIFISVPVHLTSSHHHRMFLATILIFNIIVIGSFQGQLIRSFSTTIYYPDINTLEDFEKSGMKILSSSKSLENIFGDDGSQLMKNLKKNIIIANQSGIMKELGNNRKKLATFERKTDAMLRITMYNVEENLHICNECPRSYYFTYIVPKGSPYAHVFNIVITMLRETGFTRKWNADVVNALIVEQRARQMRHQKYVHLSNYRQFSLDNLQIPFYILILGQVLASIVFCVELFIVKCDYVKINCTC